MVHVAEAFTQKFPALQATGEASNPWVAKPGKTGEATD